MSTHNLRVVVRLATLFALVLALALTGWASSLNEGSTATSRTNNDTFAGGVYIYAGGNFTNGETVNTFNWFDSGVFTEGLGINATPLLFTVTGGVYTVVGIGTSESTDSVGAQSAAFGLIAGSNVVSGANWTFGFLEGTASSTGAISNQTAGGIPFDRPVDGGAGVDPGSTNAWVFTPTTDGAITTVTLGTTFGVNGTFGLNSGTAPNDNRTYSANANGISGVAEPGTFSLITGAGLVLAGLFRYRYVRGRRD